MFCMIIYNLNRILYNIKHSSLAVITIFIYLSIIIKIKFHYIDLKCIKM